MLDAVETFWAELVVAEAAEELTDEDINWDGGLPGPHIGADDSDGVAPGFAVVAEEGDVGVRVFFDGEEDDSSSDGFGCSENSLDEWPAASADYGYDTTGAELALLFHQGHLGGRT